jgi:hypothetical protein
VINEINSDGTDYIEFRNVSGAPVDVTGWYFKDNEDDNKSMLPAGTISTFLVVKSFGFGLSSTDSVRLYNAQDQLVDAHAWAGAHVKTASRCPTDESPIIGEFADVNVPGSLGEDGLGAPNTTACLTLTSD